MKDNELKDTTAIPQDWEKIYDDLQKKYPQTSGWICPKCGAVNAPWVSRCSCVNNYYWDYQGPQPYTQYKTSHYFTDPNTGQLICWEVESACG